MTDRSRGKAAQPEVEFRHAFDASPWMLATNASQHPECWVVTVIDSKGRRATRPGEAGNSRQFPGHGGQDGREVPQMWPMEGACHVEIANRDSGLVSHRAVTFARCEHLVASEAGDDAQRAADADAIKAELSRRLTGLQPRRTWASVDDGDIWQRTEDVWDLLDPAEEHALPPDLPWSDELRQLALAEYRARFDKYLEPGGRHDITWPPEGFLASPGRWYEQEPGLCDEHGDEYAEECEECMGLDRGGQTVVDRDATWEWTVEVQTWEPQETRHGTSVELLETDPWTIGYTDVDPREVEYGPVKGSPDRAELVRRYWHSVRRAGGE